MCSHESSLWSDNPTDLIKENMLCNNYTITAKHLQFLFLFFLYFYVVRVKSPGFDAYELFHATHSHNSTQYSHIVKLTLHFYAAWHHHT